MRLAGCTTAAALAANAASLATARCMHETPVGHRALWTFQTRQLDEPEQQHSLRKHTCNSLSHPIVRICKELCANQSQVPSCRGVTLA